MSILGLAGGAITQAFNSIGQNRREQRALNNQKDLMNLQFGNQKQLNQQGHDLQFEFWKKTNYPAQMEMLKQAGLNPALMYGQAGAGGQTGSQSGGSASGGNAPAPQSFDIASNLSLAKLNEEAELLKAQKEKTQAEKQKIEGVDTEESKARTSNLLEGINSEKSKQAVLQADRWIKEKQLDKLVEEINILALDRDIKQETRVAQIQKITNDAIYSTIRNEAESQKIELTKEQTNRLWHQIRQDWVKAGLQGLDTIVKGAFRDIGKGSAGKIQMDGKNLSPKQLEKLILQHNGG